MKLVVLGAAESGVGAAILAQQKGYDVFVSDRGSIRAHYKSLLDAHALPWEEGQHTAEQILDADEVVKSPGIPDDAPMVKALRPGSIALHHRLERQDHNHIAHLSHLARGRLQRGTRRKHR